MDGGTFVPAEWLRNGTNRVLVSTTDGPWQAHWQIDEVTSDLTMLGSPRTTVYSLETYPTDTARVTPNHPPGLRLCVRRSNQVTVHGRLVRLEGCQATGRFGHGHSWRGLMLFKTEIHTYYLRFGPGQTAFPGSVRLGSDAAFSVGGTTSPCNAESDPGSQQPTLVSGAAFIGGSWLEVEVQGRRLRLSMGSAGQPGRRTRGWHGHLHSRIGDPFGHPQRAHSSPRVRWPTAGTR